MSRFSKAQLLEDLNERCEALEIAHGFMHNTGWAQVADADTATIAEYGRYAALLDLIEAVQDGTIGVRA